MIEDMTTAGRPQDSVSIYRHVKKFADFLGRSADKATTEDVIAISCAGIDRHHGATANVAATACGSLQGHAEAPRSCQEGRLDPRAWPLPLFEPEEVGRLLASATNIKHRRS